MKLQVALLGIVICLAAQAAGKSGEDASAKDSASAQRFVTGCIDEKDGQYVLLDDQLVKIVSLQSAGSDKEVFAKYLGHMVQVRGTDSSRQKGTFTVTTIKQESGSCGQSK